MLLIPATVFNVFICEKKLFKTPITENHGPNFSLHTELMAGNHAAELLHANYLSLMR